VALIELEQPLEVDENALSCFRPQKSAPNTIISIKKRLIVIQLPLDESRGPDHGGKHEVKFDGLGEVVASERRLDVVLLQHGVHLVLVHAVEL